MDEDEDEDESEQKLNKLLTFVNVGEATGIIDANVDEVSS